MAAHLKLVKQDNFSDDEKFYFEQPATLLLLLRKNTKTHKKSKSFNVVGFTTALALHVIMVVLLLNSNTTSIESNQLIIDSIITIEQEAPTSGTTVTETPIVIQDKTPVVKKIKSMPIAQVNKSIESNSSSHENNSSQISSNNQSEELSNKQKISYEQSIASLLAQHKIYPKRAKERDIEGVVTIELDINKDGSLLSQKILSSDSPLLSDGALKMIELTGQFPAFPESLNKEFIKLIIPIKFSLR